MSTVRVGDRIQEKVLLAVGGGKTQEILEDIVVTYVEGTMICGKPNGKGRERVIFNPIFPDVTA